MTDVTVPLSSRTNDDPNLFSDVYGNDAAIIAFLNSTGVHKYQAGTILNAAVGASAGIAFSKLASLTAGYVLLGNASNTPTATALSGDVTVSSSGVTAIGADKVTSAMIAANAVGSSEIAAGAVDTSELADAAVTPAKLNPTILTDTLSSDKTITQSELDSGISITTTSAGNYLVWGVFDIDYDTTAPTLTNVYLNVDGSNQTPVVHVSNVGRACVSGFWYCSGVGNAKIIKVRADKNMGGQTITMKQNHSHLLGMRVS